MKTVIIDYGLGNLGSVSNMIKKVGGESVISSKEEDILKAEKLLLPGVGSFDMGMSNLKAMGLIPAIEKRVLEDKIPILGICLGMQLMTKSSEEGKLKGLGWINAETIKFDFAQTEGKLKIPHMGWNTVEPHKKHPIIEGINFEESRYYFVHSYYVRCNKQEDELLSCKYGFDFTASFQSDNIIGIQFHPEKSHRFGMAIFKNFIAL